MADVRINNVESQLTVADINTLMTPQVMDMLVTAVRERLQQEQRMQQDDDNDRRLVEGAS